MPPRPLAERALGLLALLLAVVIWAGWLSAARAAAGAGLSAWDVALLRAAGPALLLAPLYLRQGRDDRRRIIARLAPAPAPILALMTLWGAPFVLLMSFGLATAPAALAAGLTPGAMPLWAAALGWAWLGARPSRRGALGLALIAAAASLILGPALADAQAADAAFWTGALAFTLGAMAWSAFAVAYPKSGLTPAVAAGLVGLYSVVLLAGAAVGAAALSLPPLFTLDRLPLGVLLREALLHGALAGVVAVLAFSLALDRLGPRAAVGAALTPGLAALIAWVWLGEAPAAHEALALAVAGVGVALAQSPSKAGATA